MRATRLAAFLLAALLAVAPAAGAATPASGTVSLTSPNAAWTGQAPGYAVVAVNSVVRTCQAPTCDKFQLTLADAGDLTVSATALKASGFTEVGVIKPDGTRVSADGANGQPTTSLTVKALPKGTYTAYVLTNAPASTGGDYTATAALAPARGYSGPAPAPAPGTGPGGIGDATVVAVLDTGINPYHWDFAASRMPQQRNTTTGDDMPLDRPASQWLTGFAATTGFASFDRVDLTLEENDATQRNDELREVDAGKWDAVQVSTPQTLHAYWFPGTKVIGALTFNAGGQILGADDDHGVGTTSSAVGNLHGTCPECLLFFIQTPDGDDALGEKAIDWAMQQPWIDAISNSYGYGSNDVYGRDRIYAGSNTALQRNASDRGQTIFFSAGNGIENAFLVPNQTTFSSQEGPDWIMTVGAVSPGPDDTYEPIVTGALDANGPYLGAGKPVDVAGVGSDYPTAYGAATVSATGSIGFGGTSNATPQVTGLYARSLYLARTALAGDSRGQSGGVIATGSLASGCGSARPGCELGDGTLTAAELRTRLLHGAVHHGGTTVSGAGLGDVSAPAVGEEVLAGEGHGAYLGRVDGANGWLAEQDRVLGPLLGAADVLARPAGERDWFVVDSYCRQRNWGAWSGGYYLDGLTALPPDDAAHWPVRTARAHTCPGGKVLP
ncbi:MAG: serine protease [Solirubrobacteraceae bacterium]|nr:serine protease [Solirubrobacteraceae bacterium]